MTGASVEEVEEEEGLADGEVDGVVVEVEAEEEEEEVVVVDASIVVDDLIVLASNKRRCNFS